MGISGISAGIVLVDASAHVIPGGASDVERAISTSQHVDVDAHKSSFEASRALLRTARLALQDDGSVRGVKVRRKGR
jgi:hypothetical protein